MLIDPSDATPTPGKKVILVIALQHSGEDCGGFFTEGMTQALIAEDKNEEQLLVKYIYKIVPMMNPDGLFHGVCRYNSYMEGMNSGWDDGLYELVNLSVEPEVLAVNNWLKGWMEAGDGINFATNVHSHTQREGDCAIHIRDERLHYLVERINTHRPVRTSFRQRSPGKGNFLDFFTDEVGILAVTMELSQSHNGDGKWLTIPDFQLNGAKYLNAIDDPFAYEKSFMKNSLPLFYLACLLAANCYY